MSRQSRHWIVTTDGHGRTKGIIKCGREEDLPVTNRTRVLPLDVLQPLGWQIESLRIRSFTG